MSAANIKTLKEIIFDEQRLVTYISVSKELCMHVNEVKVLLKNFIEDIKNTRPDIVLNINFIVAGLSKDNRARITVCAEGDLKTTVNSLKSVFFQHVYSICQGLSSVDNAVLASTNNFDDFPLCIGLIKGTSCSKRSSDEIGILKTNSQDAIEEPKVVIPFKKVIRSKIKIDVKKEEDVVKIQESKSEPIISIKPENNNKKEMQVGKRNGAKSNGIAGFFNKVTNTPVTIKSNTDNKKVKDEVKISDRKSEVKIEPMDVEENDTDNQNSNRSELTKITSEAEGKEDMKVNPVNNKKEIKNNSKNKKEEKSVGIDIRKKNAKVDKKRKRVLQVSDSESDEDKNDPFADEHPAQDSDDEIPPTPSTSTVKITSGIVNPKKRRKIVDKTYTDEEGFMLTRKEEVYESCSDNEDEKSTKENIMFKNHVKIEVSPPQNKGKNSKKKISPPQKGKQSSIMNFFQKK
ncbi:hypothetical protein K1T71_006647 [Dendrolimus kikuchii]|uniref:Uncharacterized protein n=1 Tax=Dendrolimus kikuchii TaxID=765133 RepID=A0ACC1D218_9NEOP|nr:hypothetical protein K1T71_006647 [Dendrolimus kikuchii]